MKALLWTTVVVLVVLMFAGDKVRGYFGYESDVTDQPVAAGDRPNDKIPTRKPDNEQRSSTGAYVPSPGDAPELYDSPATRRFGY